MDDSEPPPVASGRFPETQWSMVLAAARGDSTRGVGALGELCQLYWYPVFGYLRGKGTSAQDAQDLAQGFFLHLIEHETLTRADPHKGSFRGFLLGCLKHFACDQRDRASAQKRGGQVAFVHFDADLAEQQWTRDRERGWSEEIEISFDRRWAMVVVGRALERTQAEFSGTPAAFERLKHFLIPDADPESYETTALALGVSTSAIRATIHRLRRTYRHTLRREVAATVSAPHEVDAELRHLARVLSGP
jgi:RNA polymerase sigma-70 factor (ECF subfamily)